MGKGSGSVADKEQIKFLATNVDNLRATYTIEKTPVGKVAIESFTDKPDLERKLKDQIGLACKRAKQSTAG
jgi:hypothetical protein